jgi:TolB-like protein/Tfp pilus assembly protein PilF
MSGSFARSDENTASTPPECTTTPPADAVVAELDKILSSEAFTHAEGQQSFLRYIVEQSLQGHADQLKEYTIGLEVLHRKPSFDPRRDNTVRVKARKLRWSLSKYYETEGTHDAVRIDFPVGSYKPVFRFAAAATAVEPVVSAVPSEAPEIAIASPVSETVAPEIPVATTVATTIIEEQQPRTVTPDLNLNLARPGRKRWQVAAAVASLVVLSSFGFFWARSYRNNVTADTVPSIAVLPFRTLSAEKEDEFFSDGLTEELTDALAQLPDLRVVAANSAFQYKGKTVDVREIGRQLKVGNVLEGSVRKAGDRVRITTELSDTRTGFHIWSSSYDKEVKDVLDIQREIASAITNTLGVRLAAGSHNQAGQAGPSPEAYQAYLKGRYFASRGSARDFQRAISYLQAAIEKDPSYAPAYAALASAYAAEPNYTNVTPGDVVPKIRDNANHALSLDPQLGEAHAALGASYRIDYQWNMAEREYRKALELSPGVAAVHSRYSTYLDVIGKYQEALEEAEIARNLDPVSPASVRNVARPLYFMRRYDEALSHYQEALEFDPNSPTTHEYISLVHAAKGRYNEAVAEMEIAHAAVKDNVWYLGLLGHMYALAGRSADAHHVLTQLLHESEQDKRPTIAIALVYTGLGEKNQAIQWFGKALDQRNANLFLLKMDPMFDSLRDQSGFSALMQRMNLN